LLLWVPYLMFVIFVMTPLFVIISLQGNELGKTGLLVVSSVMGIGVWIATFLIFRARHRPGHRSYH